MEAVELKMSSITAIETDFDFVVEMSGSQIA